jgi:hypothetical protein
MATPEGDLVKVCLQYLQFTGVYCWRQNTGANAVKAKGAQKRRFIRYGMPGISDILGCMPDGRFIAVECKVGKNALTTDQRVFLETIRDAGGIGIVARSVDDVVEALKDQHDPTPG